MSKNHIRQAFGYEFWWAGPERTLLTAGIFKSGKNWPLASSLVSNPLGSDNWLVTRSVTCCCCCCGGGGWCCRARSCPSARTTSGRWRCSPWRPPAPTGSNNDLKRGKVSRTWERNTRTFHDRFAGKCSNFCKAFREMWLCFVFFL